MIGLLSACLGCLALVSGVLSSLLPACQSIPGPAICNGFVSLPLVYLGLAGILVALASLDRIRRFKGRVLSAPPPAKNKTTRPSMKKAVGVLLYLVGSVFLVWIFILSIPFVFELPNTFLEVGRANPQSLPQIVAFEAAMFGLALIGTYLAPSIKRSISKYSAVGVAVGAGLGGLNILVLILRYW